MYNLYLKPCIIWQAQSSIDTYDFDMAQRFCQKALEMDSDNVRALETTGLVMLEVQNLDAAKQVCAIEKFIWMDGSQ